MLYTVRDPRKAVSAMRPIEMIDAGIRALRSAETGELSYQSAAQTALAWAALADAAVSVQVFEDEYKPTQ